MKKDFLIDGGDVEAFSDFDSMNLRPELLRGIYLSGYERPSPIQQLAIVPLIQGRHVIAKAPSASGLTIAFVIGVLQRIDLSLPECQAIILSPDRFQALHTHRVVRNLGMPMGMDSKLRTHILIGGTPIPDDLQVLRQPGGIHVICGCPGRVFDLIDRRALKTGHVKVVILEEGLEEFEEIICDIFNEMLLDQEEVQVQVQVGLFAAAAVSEGFELVVTKKLMKEKKPIVIQSKEKGLTLCTVSTNFMSTVRKSN